jgi:energy-coupling factor transporter ATP-binding protein EcfA2
MTGAPLLEIDSLTFRYRRASEPAIWDLSLRMEPGEVLLVAGPSGCGKSTLIRAINGLIPHSYRGEMSGRVLLNGESTAELRLREIGLTVGTLLQDPAKQVVGSTVDAELAFGPENLGLERGEIRDRIADVIATTGIEAIAGRETAWLSGGEQQLLAMAGTLMMQPRLLVIDEPLANLDPATATRLLAILRVQADAGRAVVIVEHRVEEALELRPDRVLWIEDGRVRFLGPVDRFFEVADPDSVKLPFEVVLARERERYQPSGSESVAATRPATSEPAESHTPRLDFQDLHVVLGEREVLNGIRAALGVREVVAVLGPNGSGKTTMFRSAMRLVQPSSGSIEVDGSSIAERTVADLARVFGYVFQSPSQMLFARTVREELLFGPTNLGHRLDEPDALLATTLERTSLETLDGILDRPPLTLSFGQQKRLALGIALALEPRTLLLDEPSAGQDHRTAAAFMSSVLAIGGLESIYLVTHDVDLALTHADRILVIRDGRVVADGPPMGVIDDEDRWFASNLRRTSLIRANLAWRDESVQFLDAHVLARWIIAREQTDPARVGGF